MSTVPEIEKAIGRLPTREMLEPAQWLDVQLRARLEDDDDGQLSPAWRGELDARVRRRQSGETSVLGREEVHGHIKALPA
ncbi:MAG: hypothetical protein JWM59_14 [Verrucomicrobiales bacterium]|nr:hypothetical protein [Verrucomicrobiales bacterium]